MTIRDSFKAKKGHVKIKREIILSCVDWPEINKQGYSATDLA